MFALAHFYNGWTLDYIRTMSMYEYSSAVKFMDEAQKQTRK